MLLPIDGWTIAHCLAGLFFRIAGTGRRLTYALVLGWEIYQYYFHYLPQAYALEDVWLNSVVDIIAGISSYELARRYHLTIQRIIQWTGIDLYVQKVIVYTLLSSGIAWLFWDDVLRLHLSLRVPQIPLFLGALAPVFAVFTTRTFLREN